jgi:RimJ/RimL family protein N-acetyltransferase
VQQEPLHPVLATGRLRLRPWRQSDLEPFAALNADGRVMQFYPNVLDRDESDAAAARIRDHFDRHGFGLWAVEVPGVADFIGYVGLSIPGFETSFTPCVEIGWRLAFEYWGLGYATEAAQAVLKFGFESLNLPEIVSFTTVGNQRSRKVMDRLGMKRAKSEDFEHPGLPEGHRLRRHVLYRLPKKLWASGPPAEKPRKPVPEPDPACLWQWQNGPGFERCRLTAVRAGWQLQGTILTLSDGRPAQADYKIQCDWRWRTEKAELSVWIDNFNNSVTIENQKGRWYRNQGEIPAVKGCLDIDLSWSPSTNTLPIRRLDLPIEGESGPLVAAWLRFPELVLEPLPQEYKRLSEQRYLYTSRGGSFSAELEVDEHGLVIDYQGLWQRVKPTA